MAIEKLSQADLREKRKARLASAGTVSAAPAPASAPTTAAPSQTPAAPAPAPREIVARVSDMTKLSKDANVTLAGPYNEGTDNPHWIVLAEGEPLAKIALADQEKPNEIRKLFATKGYAEGFLGAASKMELTELLVQVKARPYVAAVKNTDIYTTLEQQAAAAAKKVLQERSARYRDEFQTMLNMVVEAKRKNYLMDHPLKESLFKAMKKAGVNDPTKIIEGCFAESFSAEFDSLFKQASKWLDYDAAALADIKQQITEMPVREISAAVETAPRQTDPVPSSRGNVPIVASASVNAPVAVAPTERERVKSTFNFRGRMHGHSMPNR